MALPIPDKIPLRIFYSIAHNFLIQKYGDEQVKAKSALDLQETLLDFLKEDCKTEILSYNKHKKENEERIPKIIWLLWWQGVDTASPLIKKCINRFKMIPDFQLNILDKNTVENYIDISDILPLYLKGKIFIQHLADIIRIRLLRKYGGIWCDASMIILDLDYFGRLVDEYLFLTNHFIDFDDSVSVSHGKCSTYFWATFPNNPLFNFVDDCFTGFLNRHRGVIDYTQFDYTIMLGYYNIPYIHDLLDNVPPNNQNIWWLDEHYNEQFDKKIWDKITANAPLMKLSSKGAAGKCINIKENSFFTHVINTYLEEGTV